MAWLYHFNQIVTHGMEGFLETAVPLISGLAEIIGLFIIVTSLVKATYHYVRATFFHGQHDFLHARRGSVQYGGLGVVLVQHFQGLLGGGMDQRFIGGVKIVQPAAGTEPFIQFVFTVKQRVVPP